MRGPVVVKVGGSLIDCLPRILEILRDERHPSLIVPGGGPFANTVRKLAPREEEAHWMAVAAMEQYGWYIASFGVPIAEALIIPRGTSVLLPYRLMREMDPLPHSWSVTSDTISAWVAGTLGLELLVLKSVDGLTRDGDLLTNVQGPIETPEVDPIFVSYVLAHGIRATILNGREEGRLEGFFAGIPVPCTRLDTRF
ncbi:MAG: uridylate kinase [Methanomicrobiales archaeon]|nr:uridylate kinase [Methanomicrobiales archaeon]